MTVSPDPGTATQPHVGTVLDGRYRLDRELGRGGMGRVFAGQDLKLGRGIAIKILATPSPTSSALARFRREAPTLSKLNHPNVVAVYDVVLESSVGPYLVCELLEGATLREKAAHRPPLREILVIATQIAAGLAAAHAKQIVHRDLKPENVFVTRDGTAKLIDFGIAKVLPSTRTASEDASGSDEPAPATAEHAIVGTAGYMAPEQVRGDAVDARTDVFGFGILLYELLTSRRAFQGPTRVATGLSILNDEPSIPAAVPPALRTILRRCLEKDPARRFQSGADLHRSLANVLASFESRPLWTKWTVAAVALLAAAASTALIVRSRLRPDRSLPLLLLAPVEVNGVDHTAAGALDLAFDRTFAALASVVRVQAGGSAAVAPDWVLRSSVSPSAGRVRLVARFETAAGESAGERVETLSSPEDLQRYAADVAVRVRDEFMSLWRDRNRRERANNLTRDPAATEKLLAYYDLMGANPRLEFLDHGRKLLDQAIAADRRYVPALVERSRLWRVAAGRPGEDPAEDLRRSRADAESALAVLPGDPPALLAKCLTARLQMRDWPSDTELSAARSACSEAARTDPLSVEAPYMLALLFDQGCEDSAREDALNTALDRARRSDDAWEGRVLFYLVSAALQRHHLQEGDVLSAALLGQQARAQRQANPERASLQGAHLLRAAVLLRTQRHLEAEQEIETELALGASRIGGLEESVEAAALLGLSRLRARRGVPLDSLRAARLAALERQFGAEEERSEGLSRIAGWFGFMDPDSAVAWIERHKSGGGGCAVAFQRAIIYRDAGRGDAAAGALASCVPSEEWARRCVRVISSELRAVPPSDSVSRP